MLLYLLLSTALGQTLFSMTGDCDIQGECVSSNNYPGVHGNSERCSITMLQDVHVNVGSTFNLETCCDHLLIRDVDVESSSAVPSTLNSGESFTWTSDGSVTREGWQLCFSPRGSASNYFTMSGDCDVQGDCVSSNNYPNVHGNSESCSVTMLQDATVTPGTTFNLETCCDHLMIQGSDVESSSAVPTSLNAGETFTWTSDGSVTREGWQLCFSGSGGGGSSSTYFSMSGDCDVQGDCVSSSNYPGVHGNSESCSVTMLQDATVTPGSTFNLETCCDHLMIRGVDTESSAAVPDSLGEGETFSWTSDGSVTREGWQLCFSEGSDQSTSSFFTMTGDCDMDGDCVSSNNYPNAHGNSESCSVTMLQNAAVSVSSTFVLETCCDHLMIRGVDTESSDTVPTSLDSGEVFSWTTDGSVAREGWQLCFSSGSGGGSSDYFTMTGDCDIQGDCVSSNNYPGVHGNSESCSVTMTQDASITVGSTFNLETCCDHLTIRGVDTESSDVVPDSLSAGETFTWTSDGSVTREGWQLCFGESSGGGGGSDSAYFTMTGDCDTQGDCVSSNNYPQVHGNSESCTITMLQDASVSVGSTFNLETCCDHLMIHGNDVESSDTVPTSLRANDELTWSSDGSVTREGWQLCFSEASGSNPSSDYFSMTGDCDVQGDCVSSADYPGVHGNNEQCTINVLQDASISVGSTFNLETCCDHLMIRGEDVEDSTRVPTSLNAGESFTWATDGSVTREGWQLCFSEPSGGSSSNFFTMTGDCDVQGDCVSSNNYPNVHGNGESCSVTMSQDAAVTPGSTFSLETCCDHLMIGGVDVESSDTVPSSLSAGETFSWSSDGSVTSEGWQLCFSEATGGGGGDSEFFTMTGDCDVQGDCVSSNNYPGVHGNEESCSVTMLQDASVSVGSTFQLETCCDHLMIRGVDTESSDTVPTDLDSGETFSWTTDGSVTREGWQLCFSSPSGGGSSSLFTMTGDCDTQGDCVSSNNYPSVHGNSESCSVTLLANVDVTVGSTFSLETCCDHLMIRGNDVESSDVVPPSLGEGETFSWTSDGSVTREGWQLCFSPSDGTPTTGFFTMSGDCDIDGDCVSSSNYPNVHGHGESCSVTMLEDASVAVGSTFRLETCCDHLMIRGEDVEAANAVPTSLSAGETFSWSSDGSVSAEGWQLCFSEAGSQPTPPSDYFTMTGDCDVQGDCVSSSNYPNVHGNSESCSVTMLLDASITAGSTFNLETCCDHLMIGGTDVEDSAMVPASINSGETFSWSSDGSVTREGWQLCFSEPVDTSAYFSMTGDCDVQGDCVSSAGYPGVHGNDESCTINVLQDASISVGSTFNLETCCDHLMIRDVDVEDSTRVPTELNAGESFTWSTDGSVTSEGWQLCFSEPSDSENESDYFTMTGDCDVQGDCVSSNNYPDVHGNSESCSVTILQDVSVSVGSTFALETCCDHLMIDGTDVEDSTAVPTSMNSGSTFTWSSDGSVTREGWQLCFSDSSGGTGDYFTMTGDCDVQGDCVSSNNYPNVHGNGESCSVTILQDASITVGGTFNLETCCDHLMIRGEDVESSDTVPTSINAGETFSWTTDGSVTREGWQLCFGESSGGGGSDSSDFFQMTGDCEVVNDCVQSSGYPVNHGNDEACSITMLQDASVSVGSTFTLETCCDHLMIRGIDVEDASNVPTALSAGEQFSWSTDSSVTSGGWQLCFSESQGTGDGFFTMTGDCDIQGDCVSSNNYPNAHGHSESCTVTMLQDASVSVGATFNLETCCDHLMIQGTDVESSNMVPTSLSAGEEFTWTTDGSVSLEGWQLCFATPGDPGNDSTLFSMTGDCDVQGDCVSSAGYPNVHGNNEHCEVTIQEDVSVSVGSTFNLETCCDHLMIQGNDVESSDSVPNFLSAGESFSWSTDGSVSREGWQLCFAPGSGDSGSDYFDMTGDCDTQGDCVSSANYPDVHGNGESCSITMLQDASVSVGSTFLLETCCDHLMIRGIDTESSDNVPASLNAGEQFSWTSDGSVTREGWQLCFSDPDGSANTNLFQVTGDCDTQGDCVSSANYPSAHGNSEACSVTLNQDVDISVGSTFALETCCDHLMIEGVDVESSETVPTSLSAGTTFSWTTDGSVTAEGWQLCFTPSSGGGSSNFFSMTGDCDVQGDCVSSTNYPLAHGNSESCSVTMLSDADLTVGSTFSLETCCDHLMMEGTDVESSDAVPESLTAGTTFSWTTDGSVTREGWQICFSEHSGGSGSTDLFSMTGDCDIQNDCVSSRNYPQVHGTDESCSVTLNQNVDVQVGSTFSLETCCDHLMIQGNDIEDPSTVPSSLNAGETFSWTTDGSVVREGWQLCFTPASDAPSSDYFTMTGSCDVRDDCVSSSNFPDVHGNDEACSITMQMDASVSVSDGFSLETCCDHLMIRGVDVESQDAVPRSLKAGETFSWSSDGSVTSPGWELCFSEMMSTAEPTMDGNYHNIFTKNFINVNIMMML